MYDLIIRDATILNSSRRLVADIAVKDGKIVKAGGAVRGRCREEIQGIGRFVMPGVIDARVRAGEPGTARGHAWSMLSRAALASGITAVIDVPDPTAGPRTVAELQAARDIAAAESVVDYGHWIGADGDNTQACVDAVEQGLAVGAFVRGGLHTDGGCVDLDDVPELLAGLSGCVGIQLEDGELVRKARRKGDGDGRTARAEAEAAAALAQWLKERPTPVHWLGLSTSGALNALDPFRGDLPFTLSVSPQHLFLSTETQKLSDALVATDPPVRAELDRRALWSAVKRGRIDTFHSAHVPLSEAAKGTDAATAPRGLPGIDTFLPLLLGAVKNGRLGLEQLVEMCCEKPARIFGLEGKGRIEEGADADFLLVREGYTRRLKPAPTASGVEWTPFMNREVGLLPELVVARGKVVAREGLITGEVDLGRPLVCSRG